MTSKTGYRPSVPWIPIALVILMTVIGGLRRRPRAAMLAFGLIAFGSHGLWQDYVTTAEWFEAHGHVLATQGAQDHNPFRNVIIRFTDHEGRQHDILDAAAQTYLERGTQAARDVPVLYDPARPRNAMVPQEGQWWNPRASSQAGWRSSWRRSSGRRADAGFNRVLKKA
ncbi:MAG: DUF3592 domain-containing protein [Geminicoccaceae bacterium]